MLKNNYVTYVHSGLFVTETDWLHPERIESTFEIICVKSGTLYMEEDGEFYTLNKGDLMILKPGISHKGFSISKGKTSFYWVHFNTKNLVNLSITSNYINRFTNIIMFQQLLHISNTIDYPYYSADALLLMILGEISYHFTQANNRDSQVVRDAAEWIRINSTRKLTVSEVAKRYGYSGDHFSKMFKKILKIGLKEYVYSERMKECRNLLTNSSYSVKQISSMLSFDDENQFVQFFKYHQKQSPAKFRNSIYNTHMNLK